MFHQIQTFYYIPAIKLTQDNSRLLKQSDISDSELLAEIMDMDPNTATDQTPKMMSLASLIYGSKIGPRVCFPWKSDGGLVSVFGV